MNELKKIPTAQLIEELSNREDVDSYTTTESYGVLHKAKNVDKRYPITRTVSGVVLLKLALSVADVESVEIVSDKITNEK